MGGFLREGGEDGKRHSVRGLALFSGALFLGNALRGGLISPSRNWCSIPMGGFLRGRGQDGKGHSVRVREGEADEMVEGLTLLGDALLRNVLSEDTGARWR